jgi:hypothetical protein
MPDKGTKRKDEIELDPRGWERFEAAVNAAVRTGPLHKHQPLRAKTKRKNRPSKPLRG